MMSVHVSGLPEYNADPLIVPNIICRRGMAYSIIVLNVKYVIILSTLVNQLEYVLNAQRKTICLSPHLTDVVCSILALFVIVPVSEITCQTVYVTIQSHVTQVASGSSDQCLITYAINPNAVIVQNLSN